MASSGAMRGKRILDLNEPVADPDLDLTLSLSIGGASRKRSTELEPVQGTGGHVAKLRNPEAAHNTKPRLPSTGNSGATLGNGAPSFSPFHAKVKKEVLNGAGSSSAIPSDNGSGSVQVGSGTLKNTRSLSSSSADGASLEQNQPNHRVSMCRIPSRTDSSQPAVTQALTTDPGQPNFIITQTLIQPGRHNFTVTQTLTPTFGRSQNILVTSNTTNGTTSRVVHSPCVSVRANGQGTQTVMGFIYQLSMASDLSIVCTCHWHQFSPAGFVAHAGFTNVENPLRKIVVLSP